MNLYLWNLIVSFYLMGLIWTIQIVHYPGFQFIESNKFQSFSQFHQTGMTYIVGPVMIAELILSLALLWQYKDSAVLTLFIIVLLTWLSTFLVSVPLHTKLNSGFDASVIQKLVQTNWPRTLLWTLKAGLMVYWIGSYAKV